MRDYATIDLVGLNALHPGLASAGRVTLSFGSSGCRIEIYTVVIAVERVRDHRALHEVRVGQAHGTAGARGASAAVLAMRESRPLRTPASA